MTLPRFEKAVSEVHITPSTTGYLLRLHVQNPDVFQSLIGALKRLVPSFARRFDSAEKCWHIAVEATADLEQWLSVAERRYHVEVVWEPAEGNSGRTPFPGWL